MKNSLISQSEFVKLLLRLNSICGTIFLMQEVTFLHFFKNKEYEPNHVTFTS